MRSASKSVPSVIEEQAGALVNRARAARRRPVRRDAEGVRSEASSRRRLESAAIAFGSAQRGVGGAADGLGRIAARDLGERVGRRRASRDAPARRPPAAAPPDRRLRARSEGRPTRSDATGGRAPRRPPAARADRATTNTRRRAESPNATRRRGRQRSVPAGPDRRRARPAHRWPAPPPARRRLPIRVRPAMAAAATPGSASTAAVHCSSSTASALARPGERGHRRLASRGIGPTAARGAAARARRVEPVWPSARNRRERDTSAGAVSQSAPTQLGCRVAAELADRRHRGDARAAADRRGEPLEPRQRAVIAPAGQGWSTLK